MIKGGEFLISNPDPGNIFIPEEWNEEQRMMYQSCRDFLEKEVYPQIEKIDSMEHPEIIPGLLEKAGNYGFLGASVPEEYGGLQLDFNSALLLTEGLGAGHAFTVAATAHNGIGTLPIVYYGTQEQKKKYLPKLVNCEWKAAYCLTEPEAGSDANAGKSKATCSSDGKYFILNGQKMWISNAGFADIFIVFAKVDHDRDLSAFIVEKGFNGISMGPEEKKLGMKGASTRQVFFTDCRIPVDNLLGERGKGFRIALNILNTGRIRLGAATLGGCKKVIERTVQYANQRHQFGQAISSFGAIKHKLAEMAVRTYSLESALYRTGRYIDDAGKHFLNTGMTPEQAKLKSAEQFAIECALLKVYGSETLDYCVDEGLQVFGGMGYSAEAPMERAYRDSRINRIFEGTNEINRLMMIDMLLKKAMKGDLDLMGPVQKIQKELTSIPESGGDAGSDEFGTEKKILSNLKKTGLLIAGAAVRKLMMKLKDEQEIIMNLADMLIEGYTAESTVLRAQRIRDLGLDNRNPVIKELGEVAVHNALGKASISAREALYGFAEGDELRLMNLALKRYLKTGPYNIKEARRKIADFMIAENTYAF